MVDINQLKNELDELMAEQKRISDAFKQKKEEFALVDSLVGEKQTKFIQKQLKELEQMQIELEDIDERLKKQSKEIDNYL